MFKPKRLQAAGKPVVMAEWDSAGCDKPSGVSVVGGPHQNLNFSVVENPR